MGEVDEGAPSEQGTGIRGALKTNVSSRKGRPKMFSCLHGEHSILDILCYVANVIILLLPLL